MRGYGMILAASAGLSSVEGPFNRATFKFKTSHKASKPAPYPRANKNKLDTGRPAAEHRYRRPQRPIAVWQELGTSRKLISARSLQIISARLGQGGDKPTKSCTLVRD